MNAAPRLELRALHKSFPGTSAVKDLSLTLEQGEFVSLLGPSGCGKSTTLAMIAGFEFPDSGDLLINGTSVMRTAAGKRGVGIVFQDYGVFTRLTVRENLAFGLGAQGLGKSRQAELMAEMATRLDFQALLHQRASDLNISELQRVALGRALITRPSLLLLDEPMANLDSGLRGRLRGELRRIQKSLAQTVLYVTHDQVEAMALSDRIAVMDGGRLQQVGTPGEIYSRPRNRFVAEFIGDPQINLLPCTVRSESGALLLSTAAHRNVRKADASTADGDYLLGIRPHHVRISRSASIGSAACKVRYIDNLGPEHVLHIEYGSQLLRALVPPAAASVEEVVHVQLDVGHAILIDTPTGNTVDVTAGRRLEAA